MQTEAWDSLSCPNRHGVPQQAEHASPETRSSTLAAAQEEDVLLSPENRPMLSSKVAAQRAIFSDPVPRKPGAPARDIAGRWHGRPPTYWSACDTP